MVIYNPIYGLYSLCRVNFFFNRGGHIHKMIHLQSSWSDPFHWNDPSTNALMLFCDLVWSLSLLYIAVKEVAEMVSIVKRYGPKGIWSKYLSFWNWVDWVSIICAIIMMSNLYQLLGVGETTDKAFQSLIDEGATDVRIKIVYEEVERLVRSARFVQYWLVFYPGIIMLRLFKAFAAQPRLAVVTETLRTAWQDIFHFCIVFLSIFVSFTISGNILFGQDLEGFATLDRSFLTCFRCMLGDFDWDAFESIGRAPAGVWFGLFMAVVNILLLNMSMAIIMGAYDDVRLKAGNAQTLLDQIVDIQRRSAENRKGLRVSLAEVLKAFALQEPDEERRMSDETPLTKQNLINVVSQYRNKVIPDKQAERVLRKAETWYHKKMAEEEAEEAVNEGGDQPSSDPAQLQHDLQQMLAEVQALREMADQSTKKASGCRSQACAATATKKGCGPSGDSHRGP